jgi:hypothetical protein
MVIFQFLITYLTIIFWGWFRRQVSGRLLNPKPQTIRKVSCQKCLKLNGCLITEFGNKDGVLCRTSSSSCNGPVHYGEVQTSDGFKNKECFVMMLPKMNSQLAINTCWSFLKMWDRISSTLFHSLSMMGKANKICKFRS